MIFSVTEHGNLAAVLAEKGADLDRSCGGKGVCGHCRVQLLTGRWRVSGREVTAPAEVPACRTELLGDAGSVEVPGKESCGQISDSWRARPFPVRDELVIGVDAGTTTIAAAALQHGRVISRAACFNGQRRFGADCASRIAAAAGNPGPLQKALLQSVEEVISALHVGVPCRIAVAGNTVMSCLLHGIDPASIGRAPFAAPCRIFPARKIRGVELLTMPCIGGFTGGDLTAGLRECALENGEMLVDVGTNCEIACRTGEGFFCTSAAAGPAFEGSGVSCGCRAQRGAVDHLLGDSRYHVLGGGTPQGLCGSALIDLLALGRKEGFLDEYARITSGEKSIRVAENLVVTEEELASLLTAKAAVYAGIRTLEEHAHFRAKRICLAGGFAQYLSPDSARRAGLLPDRVFEIVGNTSLAGALRLAAEPETLAELEAFSAVPRELPLSELPEFEGLFCDALRLP